VPKIFFAVLYVSIMGLTRCHKMTVFYIYMSYTAWINLQPAPIVCLELYSIL